MVGRKCTCPFFKANLPRRHPALLFGLAEHPFGISSECHCFGGGMETGPASCETSSADGWAALLPARCIDRQALQLQQSFSEDARGCLRRSFGQPRAYRCERRNFDNIAWVMLALRWVLIFQPASSVDGARSFGRRNSPGRRREPG